MKNLVLLGTARGESHTLRAIRELCPFKEYEIIDLRNYNLKYYSYDHSTNLDEFLAIAENMTTADNIVFATPVYWYSMSGVLKVFFDRLTELLTSHKSIGKALKGKKTFLISTGSDPELPPGFEVPFRLTSKYFEMNYERAFYLPAR